jgi:serine protease
MKISVVDLTTGAEAVRTEDLLRVIRAVNRQLREDFAPYWHMHGDLRLDQSMGPAGDRVRPHLGLRGDGILYLMNRVDPQAALGYHERHNLGVPYGMVFLDVSAELEKNTHAEHPWSITLSHEAMELVADPQVNLMCKGPHPDPTKSYEVFHWFEMSDAVQAESYLIDGIAVSNFLLPTYFTASDARDERNDFLSRRSGGPSLPAFGVKPGGYIGYFDPVVGGDHQYLPAGDAEAERRAEVRRVMEGVRRRDRRTLARPLGRRSGPAATPISQREAMLPQTCEGLFLRLATRARDVALIVDSALGAGWRVDPFWGRISGEKPAPSTDYLVRRIDRAATLTEAWTAAHDLTAQRDVVVAEPLFELAHPAPPPPAPPPAHASTGLEAPPSSDRGWSLAMVAAGRAWEHGLDSGAPNHGNDIVIGHPDTGYTPHPEITASLMLDRGVNFLERDRPPIDPLTRDALIPNPGHGTATASVIASAIETSGDHVTGVAPAARVVPLRVSPSVVLVSMCNLARAIRYAADAGCHIVSISMGGLFSLALHEAVRYAVDQGVIVVAAAGNDVGFVVWPAAYDEAIAVAAVGPEGRPWSGTSRGRAVDISAPGESVWHATTEREGDDGYTFRIASGSGTSFAVASVAGVAALWLARHGRQILLDRYGGEGLVATFKEILATSGYATPPSWDANEMGPGIVDALRVVQAPLPTIPLALGMRAARQRLAPIEEGGLATLRHLLPSQSLDAITSALAELFAVDSDGITLLMRDVGRELCFLVAGDKLVRDRLIAVMTAQQGALRSGGRDLYELRALISTRGSVHLEKRIPAPRGTAAGG